MCYYTRKQLYIIFYSPQIEYLQLKYNKLNVGVAVSLSSFANVHLLYPTSRLLHIYKNTQK